MDPVDETNIVNQMVGVFDTQTGQLRLVKNATPILSAGQNYALSPDGSRFAICDRVRLKSMTCRHCRQYLLRRQQTQGTENVNYSLNNSRNRRVCARLTGISVCFLSSMRSW